jgi:putative tricarboxylic transport membrane protein
MLLVLNLPLAGLWVRLLRIPRPWLQGGIVLFAVIGVFGASRALADVAILAGVGLLGFVLKWLDYPLAPVVVGLILGPMAEVQFRRGLQIAQGDYGAFLDKPIAVALFALAAIMLVLPTLIRFYTKRKISF